MVDILNNLRESGEFYHFAHLYIRFIQLHNLSSNRFIQLDKENVINELENSEEENLNFFEFVKNFGDTHLINACYQQIGGYYLLWDKEKSKKIFMEGLEHSKKHSDVYFVKVFEDIFLKDFGISL